MSTWENNAAPCGWSPQGAALSSTTPPFDVVALPTSKTTARYEAPDPNPETLKKILQFHGCPEFYIDTIVNGYAPREFQPGMTRFWKVRDAFYRLAAHSVHCFMGNAPSRLTIETIGTMIVETIKPQDLFLHELVRAMNSVVWFTCGCSTGRFIWPSFITCCSMQQELMTAIRLYVLYNIWCMNPVLLPVDFSWGLGSFTNAELAHVQSLIDASIQAVSPTEATQVVAESTPTAQPLTAEVQQLLDILQDGPKSRQELQEKLDVGRTALLKRFLAPARESGLVVTTEQGSSPNQRYRLVSSTDAAGWKQASDNTEAGLIKPVSSGIVLPQKQDKPKVNGVFSPVVVSSFASGRAPVRLARYVRWLEAERVLILFGRVERYLRSWCVSEDWKKLGIVDKLNASDLLSFENCLFAPKIWGAYGGVVLQKEVVDKNDKHWAVAVGESNLLCFFAQKAGFDLAVCSEAEYAEMGRLAEIIPPAVLQLVNFFAQRFSISRDLNKPYHGDSKAMQSVAIEPFNLYHPSVSKIVFHGKDRAPQLQVARLDVEGRTLLLPVTFYASAQNPMLYSMMPEVPDTPILYNSDLIAANPSAEIILTDEFGIPLVNDSDGDYIFSSCYGGVEFIEKLDHDQLEGHPARWLCFDTGEGPVKMYEKGVKVGRSIFQQHGRKINFQVFDGVTWTRNVFGMETGTYESTRGLSFDEFMTEAAKYGVSGCGSKEVADLRVLSMVDLLKIKPEDYVLYPVLKPGFYCLIYGGTGVSKTWFALHLAICLSQGLAPFKHWEYRATVPCNMLYVAGEMRESEYGDRLRKLLAKQEANPHFGLIRADLDLTTEADQESIFKAVKAQQSKVVVLDNLSTLATNGHTEGQFEKIFGFICKLTADGVIVLLVHHENREGNFKGSGKIELVADQSLHLFSAGNGDKIELLVRAEKIRMTSRAEQTAFHTVFDPENPTTVWETRPLTPEERDRLDIDDPLGEVEQNIGKKRKNDQLAWEYLDEEGRGTAIIDGMLNGCHDDVIAADLAIRESVIANFKQEHGISPDTINLHRIKAKEIVKNNSKKVTPSKLAPEIWKLLKNNKE